ncbi:hypothetical protein BDV59DRAFT_108693 [Aspergillus ambiguus]|uniref:Zn(II)2Cys6 transcription factor n=1 Tax=Aspergillus ambiguus TaxID=176160 RepID=UPI003CCE14A7
MLISNNVISDRRLMSSRARLRTRSGCGECRGRRKKCDEKRPRCGGCIRNDLTCTWPTERQPLDRRTYTKASGLRHRQSVMKRNSNKHYQLLLGPSVDSTERCLSSSLLTMPSPFQQEEHLRLYRFFADCVLPLHLVRRTSLSRYSDQKHMLGLAFANPPLMGAIIAIAAMKEMEESRGDVRLAVESYLFTIESLRKGIADGKYFGNEDWLLATTILLCVFENARCDSMPNAGPHLLASGKLLTLRTPRSRNRPQAAVVFERVCAESFLYHAVLMTLFDSSLDCLSSLLGALNLTEYFSDPVHPEDATLDSSQSTQPILDTSYKFYLLIVDVVWLARASFTPKSTEYTTWLRLRDAFAPWEAAIDRGQPGDLDNDVKKLYAIGMRMLLAQANPLRSAEDVATSLELWFNHGLTIIKRLNVQNVFAYYYLWPLVVVGSIATNSAHRTVIEGKIYQIFGQQRQGSVALASHHLKSAWAQGYRCDGHNTRILEQFRTILQGS